MQQGTMNGQIHEVSPFDPAIHGSGQYVPERLLSG
jgi:hypothetical protein